MTDVLRSSLRSATKLVNKIQRRTATMMDYTLLDAELDRLRAIVANTPHVAVQLERVTSETHPAELHKALARVGAALIPGVVLDCRPKRGTC